MAKQLQKLELTWIGKGNEPKLEPRILIEVGSRSLIDPFDERHFKSMLGEHFKGQAFADEPITIPCVHPGQ